MPIPLRSIGCLPVVASLLPPGTRLTALRVAHILKRDTFSRHGVDAPLASLGIPARLLRFDNLYNGMSLDAAFCVQIVS